MSAGCRIRSRDMPPKVRDQHAEAAVRLLRELSRLVREADHKTRYHDMAEAVDALRRREGKR